jgi:hypothetical protein
MAGRVVLYEKKIASFPELIRELDIIDLDAGVRIAGKFKGKKCFVFVTRSPAGFTSILSSVKRVGKDSVPDKRILVRDFQTIQELEGFLGGVITKPLVAAEY